jgi:TetR/AcrR family transcriptional regulator, regulator of cefoperazone and chloramphenicol sensitivity
MNKHAPESTKSRQRILLAACELFADKGLRNTTIRDICQKAGANVAGVNYHFGSKDKLYETVCKHLFGLSEDKSYPIFKIDKDLDPEQKLRLFIQNLLSAVLCKGKSVWMEKIMGREMIESTGLLDIIVKEIIRPRYKQLLSIVKELIDSKATNERALKCCLSIVGQCLYYRFARPIILQINPQQKFDADGIKELAEHITLFSLGAIKHFSLTNTEKE